MRLLLHNRGRAGGGLLVLALVLGLLLAGCGTRSPVAPSRNDSASASSDSSLPRGRPQAVEPTAGEQATYTPDPTVGDPTAHAPPISEVQHELKLELVAASVNSAGYINPLRFVNHWERTDQGVDANMPVGAPILAPGPVKILAVIPDWYAGQPLIYWELLNGPDAGKVQYVAEEINNLARPGSFLKQGQTIATYAASGTGIEFGWSTTNGVTLAMATTGYGEGEATPAGRSIRAWLNALGAGAGPG